MYAVFVVINNEWKLSGVTYQHKYDADRECSYYINMLGIQAKVFKRL